MLTRTRRGSTLIESQIQEGDPKETAKTMEFMKQFRQRRIDRGLPVP
jgi:hypothetical protein